MFLWYFVSRKGKATMKSSSWGSKDHRIIHVAGELRRSFSPIFCSKQGQLWWGQTVSDSGLYAVWFASKHWIHHLFFSIYYHYYYYYSICMLHSWLRLLTRIILTANFWIRLQNLISRSLQSNNNMYIEIAINIWLAFVCQPMRWYLFWEEIFRKIKESHSHSVKENYFHQVSENYKSVPQRLSSSRNLSELGHQKINNGYSNSYETE